MSAHINSDHEDHEDTNQPQATLATPTPNKETQMMIKAIDAIIKLNIPSKIKLHNPNPFDGSCKLHTFLLQCRLNFWNCQDHFQDNSVKGSYDLSFLKGMTLECFEPRLLVDNEPAWLSNFGIYDPVGEAEAVMVHPPTPHVFPKPCLNPWCLGPSANLSEWPPTHLDHHSTSYSLSWTPVCFLFFFFYLILSVLPVYILISDPWSWHQSHIPSFRLCPWLAI